MIMDLLGQGVCLLRVSSVRLYLCREKAYGGDEHILEHALLLWCNVNKPTTHLGWGAGLCRDLRVSSSISYLHLLFTNKGQIVGVVKSSTTSWITQPVPCCSHTIMRATILDLLRRRKRGRDANSMRATIKSPRMPGIISLSGSSFRGFS